MAVTNTLRIFLVDDDVFYKAIFQQLMHSLDYKNVWYYASAEDMMNDDIEAADVVFIDYGMDTLKGAALLKLLKVKNPQWYVVIISANEDAAIIADLIKLGAFDYVVKGHNEAIKLKEILIKIQKIQDVLKKNRYIITNK